MLGVTVRNNNKDTGRDAVFLNCLSPYAADAFERHNFGVGTGQYTVALMSMKGVMGSPDL